MQRITTEQFKELKDDINNIKWRDNQRRKQIDTLNKNVARHEQILKGKFLVPKFDSSYEEPYDQSEQENSH